MNITHSGNTATMNSREIAALTGKRHDNVKRTIESLVESGVIESPQIEEIPTTTRPVAVYVFSGERGKRDSIVVVAQLSPEFTAALVDRWDALEKALRSAPTSSKLAGELAIMECYTRLLRPAPSSQTMMLAKIAQQNGLNAQFLPAYAVDAAANSADGSSMPTKALTALLREHGVGMGAAAFNHLLDGAGYLQQLTRKNGKGDQVPFWSVTALGLDYGKNLTSPSNPRETQPHWYVERFHELVGLVLGRRVA